MAEPSGTAQGAGVETAGGDVAAVVREYGVAVAALEAARVREVMGLGSCSSRQASTLTAAVDAASARVLAALAARAREAERLEARVRVAEDRERQNAEVAARWQRAAGEAEREAADLRARLLEREEREAACCPEDVGFPEYIAALRARCERLEQACERLVAAQARAAEPAGGN